MVARAPRFVFCGAMSARLLFGLVAVALVLVACGGDKPPMVPDPETTPADAGAE
jgi:hypothetical protein